LFRAAPPAVTLISFNAAGCSDTGKTLINIFPKPIAAFFASDTIKCLNADTIRFTNKSTYAALGSVTYNWYIDGVLMSSSKDFKYIDRFVRVKGMPQPARNTNEESNFILNDSFAEQLVPNFLSSDDQRKIWRSLCDIIDESEGSGNAKVALSDAKLLASRILMKRSSTENALALNERSAHIEQRTRSSITTKTNQIRPTNSGGWLSRLFGH